VVQVNVVLLNLLKMNRLKFEDEENSLNSIGRSIMSSELNEGGGNAFTVVSQENGPSGSSSSSSSNSNRMGGRNDEGIVK